MPTSTGILIEANTKIRLQPGRAVKEHGSITLNTGRGSRTGTRTHGRNMVSQGLAQRIEEISEDKRLTPEAGKGSAGRKCPAEMLLVVIALQRQIEV